MPVLSDDRRLVIMLSGGIMETWWTVYVTLIIKVILSKDRNCNWMIFVCDLT